MKKQKHTKIQAVLKIQSQIRQILGEQLRKREFIELSPVILSPITDPLNHPATPAKVQCYGKDYNISTTNTRKNIHLLTKYKN